jgi:hypothetical protein
MTQRAMLGSITGFTLLGLGLVVASGYSGGSPDGRQLAAERLADTAYPAVAAVPDAVSRSLAEFDISVDPVPSANKSDAGSTPLVSVRLATDISRGHFGIGSGGVASTATLAVVTLGQDGKELEPDHTKPSRIDPRIKDRLAWVITFEDAPVQVHGPPGDTGPSVVYQTVVTFIDPATGEFLAGISF